MGRHSDYTNMLSGQGEPEESAIYRGYEIKREEGRRSRPWSWRAPTCEWQHTGWTDKGFLMIYLDGLRDAWQAGKDVIQKGEGE